MEEKLGLNPGPNPRRRKPISICRCLCWTIGFPLFCFTAGAIIYYGHGMVEEVRFPHKALYHPGASYNPEDVIRPLISEQQTFDIAVSVWVRAPEDEQAEYKRLKASVTIEEAAPASSQIDLGGNLGKVWVTTSLDGDNRMYRNEDILETPLFSDVVFRGLRLSDRHVSATVNFRLPTARFLAADLTESDLRATFLLVPSSPSLLDHVKNFSSWMPDSVYAKRRPTRPWPFPLGSDERGERTMIDLALESFSISVPLIELHDAASQCPANGALDASVENTEKLDEEPVVEGHPYVVTRTQLRIIRETRLFNASAYNAVRDEIKLHSCGQGIPGIRPNLRMCRRTYKSNGNFETRLELEVPTETGVETQWAYAPYLDTKAHATGPLDIIPVPVTRENCSSMPRDAEEKDYMDVSWRIAFSGRTPAKQLLGDNFVSPHPPNHRASDMTKVNQQDEAELWNGAFGHRFHDDAHPRRRIGFSIVSNGCALLSVALLVHYWWTRVSTAGISTSSVRFLAAAIALGQVVDVLKAEDGDYGTLIMAPVILIIPYLMGKAILRAEFGWKRWYPTLTRAPANHRERASQRMDNRTSWWTKLGVFGASLAIYYFVNPDKVVLIPSTGPALRPEERGHLADSQLLAFLQSAASALYVAGNFSQVLLNHRSSTYGGGYRAQVVLMCAGTIVGLLSHFVPVMGGRMEWRMALSLESLDIILYFPLLWQAITLRPAEIGDEEED
ncbi:hypothetical protein DFH09DRAFT_374094 [Mycena vulgaris]|nr:hypothetical protein DFH09DRAFT_374094 [Mycena vulgaris]